MTTCLPSRKLYKLDEPDTQDTLGEARTNSSVMYSYEPLHMVKQKQDDQLELTYSSYVRIRDVDLKTCQMRWMIGGGERGSGISVLASRHDDDDDIYKEDLVFEYLSINELCSHLVVDSLALRYNSWYVIKPKWSGPGSNVSYTFIGNTVSVLCPINEAEKHFSRFHHHHHHHVVPPAQIFLTISRHFSLSFIASGRSSGLHYVSSHSSCL